jgi:aminopeptidase-like protein
VTQEELDQAQESAYVEPREGKRLSLVELLDGDERKLPGEIRRFGRVAVVSASYGDDLHTVFGRHDLYAEDISGPETDHPTEAQAVVPEMVVGLPTSLPSLPIDREFILQKLKEYSGEVTVTINGKPVKISERRSADGRALARAWLKQEYQKLGFATSEHTYGGRFASGSNFVAEKAAKDGNKQFVILSAHLDSVGNAGADDDGAGIVSSLAIAKALSNVPLKYSLRVLAFDQEENGLVGSSAYARYLSDNRVIGDMVGNFNLEMTGYDSDGDGEFHAIDCNENTSADLTGVMAEVLQDSGIALEKVDACTNRSDHASFWRYDRPAIVLSENFFGGDGNPCYHKSCDRIDRVNVDYMTKITRLAGLTIAAFVSAR